MWKLCQLMAATVLGSSILKRPPDVTKLKTVDHFPASEALTAQPGEDIGSFSPTLPEVTTPSRVSSVRASLCRAPERCKELHTLPHSDSNRRKRSADHVRCELEVLITAFDANYSLCLFAKKFKEESILKRKYDQVNVTVYQEMNKTMEIPLSTLELEYIAGYVLEEPSSSVTGYLMDHHFFGIIYIQDHVHYMEPSLKRSRDLHIYLEGVNTLLGNRTNSRHRHQIEKHESRICELTLVSDHFFYSEVGNNSLHNTVLQMLWHVKEANRFLAAADFDSDGKSDCLGITVGEITVFTSVNSSVNLLTGDYSLPEDFLKRFSRYNFQGFCLGALFTSREFADLVLGLAWRGNPLPDGVGGTCQSRVRIKTDTNAYSFNALFLSMRSKQEKRIPIKMGVLNLVHEILHSFGARHDPEAKERPDCTPLDKYINGRYLMSQYSNDGHKLNHQILSPCTKEAITASLKSAARVSCLLRSTDSVCGNGLLEEGEECDCGTSFVCTTGRFCCSPPEGFGNIPPCRIRPNMTNCIL